MVVAKFNALESASFRQPNSPTSVFTKVPTLLSKNCLIFPKPDNADGPRRTQLFLYRFLKSSMIPESCFRQWHRCILHSRPPQTVAQGQFGLALAHIQNYIILLYNIDDLLRSSIWLQHVANWLKLVSFPQIGLNHCLWMYLLDL